MTKEKVAFLGTGLMGFPMALNLTRSGVPLTVWNRTQTKANPLALEGAKVASNIVDAVKEADIVISMMSDGPTVLAVIEDVLQSLKPEALWADMSSTKPAEGRLQAAILLEQNITHLDAQYQVALRVQKMRALPLWLVVVGIILSARDPYLK